MMSKLLEVLQRLRLAPQVTHLIRQSNKAKGVIAPRQMHQIQKDTVGALLGRMPIYLASVLGLISVGTLTHCNDDYFRYYPLPFAIDIGDGQSMLPTMIPGDIYWRDCFSNRFFWINWGHIMQIFSDDRKSTGPISLRRPWQRGDIVTIFNPHSKTIICKRIIGLEGDKIQVYGEYAQAYFELNAVDNGVPYDDRYLNPFCREEASKQKTQPTSVSQITITVPPNHVWLEGDNPLCSSDSRHFGPLPLSTLRGRVVMRLWPIRHELGSTDTSLGNHIQAQCTMSAKRPPPFMTIDQMLRNKLGCVRKMVDNNEETANG